MAGETSESRVFMNFYYRITAGAASRGVAGRRGAGRFAVRGNREKLPCSFVARPPEFVPPTVQGLALAPKNTVIGFLRAAG